MFADGNELRSSIEKALESRWGEPWAQGIIQTVTRAMAHQGWHCQHEVAVYTLGDWLLACSEQAPPILSMAAAMEARYGSFARECRFSVGDWRVFSRNLWLLTALAHDQCLSLERHFRQERRLAAAHPVVGHVYKSKVRKNHIWKSLRGSLFMRRVGKERLFAGLQHHSPNLHGFLSALDLLIPHHEELRTPLGLSLQAVACAVALYEEQNLSFQDDPLGCWLALVHGIIGMAEPGRTFTDDGHPTVVSLAGRALHVVFPSFQALHQRLGSASGLQDRARSLTHRLEKAGFLSPISFQFGSTES